MRNSADKTKCIARPLKQNEGSQEDNEVLAETWGERFLYSTCLMSLRRLCFYMHCWISVIKAFVVCPTKVTQTQQLLGSWYILMTHAFEKRNVALSNLQTLGCPLTPSKPEQVLSILKSKEITHFTCNSEEQSSVVIEAGFTSQQGPVVRTFILNSLVPIMFNFSSLPFHVNTPLIITLFCRLCFLDKGVFSNWVWQSSWPGSVFRFQKCFIQPQAVGKEHQRYVKNKSWY